MTVIEYGLWAIVSHMIIIATTAFIFYRMGRKQGKFVENDRCQKIIMAALYIRVSPSTREALSCVAGNQTVEEMKTVLRDIGIPQ